jgi:hypothetical protein
MTTASSATSAQTSPPESNSSQPPSRESILGFLDSEIARVTTEQQQPGWSKWALSGALATVSWLLLSQWETQKYNATHVRALIVAIALILPGLAALGYVLAGVPSRREYYNRALALRDVFGPARIGGLFNLLRCVAVAICTYLIFGVVPGWLSWLTFMLLAIDIASALFMLAIAYTDWHIPRFNRISLFLFVLPIANVLVGLAYIDSVYTASSVGMIPDIRFAALFATGWILLVQLISPEGNAPLLGSMVTVRQRLALGQMGVEDAIRQIDILIAGLRLEDAMQAHVRRVLQLAANYDEGALRQEKRQNVVEGMLASLNENTPEEELLKLQGVIHQYNDEHRRLAVMVSRDVERARLGIEIRFALLSGMADQTELASLRSNVETAFAGIITQAQEYEVKSRAFRQKTDSVSTTLVEERNRLTPSTATNKLLP